jgi:hypothetical protein
MGLSIQIASRGRVLFLSLGKEFGVPLVKKLIPCYLFATPAVHPSQRCRLIGWLRDTGV